MKNWLSRVTIALIFVCATLSGYQFGVSRGQAKAQLVNDLAMLETMAYRSRQQKRILQLLESEESAAARIALERIFCEDCTMFFFAGRHRVLEIPAIPRSLIAESLVYMRDQNLLTNAEYRGHLAREDIHSWITAVLDEQLNEAESN